jgi:hypothetical protein
LIAGVAAGSLVTAVLVFPGQERFHAHGPMNTGHQNVACDDCHRAAPGTFRQQLQANARYLIGRRSEAAEIGRLPVDNAACLDCHERPDDRHPVFRFRELRFAEARRAIAPHRCESCHLEHSGRRVTRDNGFCVNCHGTLEMKVDPLDVAHAELVRTARWESCLGCHDFHGNHLMEEPTRLADATDPARLAEYFAGGASPYPEALRHPARTKIAAPAAGGR